MKLGVMLNAVRGADGMMDEARAADAQGFDSVWIFDHLTSFRAGAAHRPDEPLETWTLASAIGGATSRIRLGFATLNSTFRYPTVLAKMITTLDQVTHGRVIASVGAGWLESECRAYNLPFISDHAARLGYSREVVRLFRELWTNPAPALTTFKGEYLSTHELPFNPAPYQSPHPPIWIGGDSEDTLQSIRELQPDGWIMLKPPIGRAALAAVTGAPGWPAKPMTICFSFGPVIVGSTHAEAEAIARDVYEAARKVAGPPVPATFEEYLANPRALVGSVEECVARIREVESWGYSYARVSFGTTELQASFAKLVLPRLAVPEPVAAR